MEPDVRHRPVEGLVAFRLYIPVLRAFERSGSLVDILRTTEHEQRYSTAIMNGQDKVLLISAHADAVRAERLGLATERVRKSRP